MDDQANIQGTWALVTGERHGQPFPEDVTQHVTLTFSGDKLITKTRDRQMEATFTLDVTKEPKHIDLNMGGAVGKGIYQLDGDALKIAHGEVGDPRPAEFPISRSQWTILVLKRARAASGK